MMRLFLNLNAIYRHPLNRDKRREFRRNQLRIKNCGKRGQLDSSSRQVNREQLDETTLDAAFKALQAEDQNLAAAPMKPEREQVVETTLDAAFKAMKVGDPHLAASLFDEAIGPDQEAAASDALHQYGVALAWVGRLDDAERALRLAFKKEPSASIAYGFGSVLAEQRKFAEANAAFATIDRPQPWLSGGSARSICLPERKDDLHAFDVPFRRTLNGLFDGSACDHDFVYFVAADPRYVKRFARALHSSLAAVHGNCLLHIHVINPDAATIRLVAYMKERPGPTVTSSSEEVDLSGLSNDQRRVYYASARFFILSALRRHYGKPVIAADIDQIVLRNPAFLIDSGSDVAAIRFPYGRFNLLSRFSASAIIASTPAAATYFDRVATYIAGRMRDLPSIAWHLDQIALDVAYLVSDDIALSEFPPGAMLSAGPDADVPNDTYFWSITYSIAANARKLVHPIFQKLETTSLIVVTPVFDQSDGLARTIAGVARAGYSNVAHVVIDHRAPDGDLDLNEAGSAGFVINESTKGGGSFTDLMKEMPNATFVELPCGALLAERTLVEIMLAIETDGSRLHARRSDGIEVIDLPAGIGLGSKGERLTVFRKAEWTEHNSKLKVLARSHS
jgi:tetratricopeptide (TPR) repeat protein